MPQRASQRKLAGAKHGRVDCVYIGLARTIYIRFTYGIIGMEITKYTVIYGVYTVLANPADIVSRQLLVSKWNVERLATQSS
jgi:hypothetical protein